jgi:hypothetical protein
MVLKFANHSNQGALKTQGSSYRMYGLQNYTLSMNIGGYTSQQQSRKKAMVLIDYTYFVGLILQAIQLTRLQNSPLRDKLGDSQIAGPSMRHYSKLAACGI